MNRHRIVATAPGARYTVSLVRFLNDEQAIKLMIDSRGKARGMLPIDLHELVTYRETFSVSGMTDNRQEIGRCMA